METNFIVNLAELYRNNEFLKKMFDDLRLSIWYRNLEDHSFWVSSESAKIFGYKQRDFENNPQLWKNLIFLDDAVIVEHHTKRLFSGKASTIEYRIVRSDGVIRWIQETASSIKDEHGKVILNTSIVLDITECKTAALHLSDTEEHDRHLVKPSPNPDFLYEGGHSKSETPHNLKVNDLIIPEEKDQADPYIKLVKKGTQPSAEKSIHLKNHSLIHLDNILMPVEAKGQFGEMVGTSQDTTHQAKIENLIKYEDSHDYLTGLPNRSMLHSRLSYEIARASETKKSIAVLLLNLNRFKVVNDTLDHNIGDLLLKKVTTRLKSSIYDNDIIFRQSGDEFIIVLIDADRDTASKVAERILDALAAPHMIKSHNILISASIGISLFKEDGETAETLIKNADFAMRQAKSAGKNMHMFYFSNEGGFNLDPLKMEMDLCKAAERDELLLHYQPKVNLKTGNIVGFEALLRWNHPDWGMLSPASFIPFAEETGLIMSIGEWVLYHACKQNKAWQRKSFSWVIAVNVSVRQLTHPNIVNTIACILQETELEPRYLEIEITGSITIGVERILSTLQQLKSLGVQISIDDFGTAFNSFSYLTQFPVDTLKIDQSFIKELHNNPNEEAIIKNLILMAHNLNLKVTAEAIETEEQLVFLQQHLCDEGQGYFFSSPLPASEIEKTFQEIQQLVKKHGISQDLNEQMWTKELLDRAQKEMQDTIRLQQGMIFKFKKINDQFIHTLCDGELLYRLGLIPSQVVGKGVHDFLPIEAAEERLNYYQVAWEKEKVVTYESMVMNGISYLTVLCPVKKGGKVVEIIGSAVDITARKQIEQALQESENKYRLIAENMTDLICLLDSGGKVVYASPSHGTVLGFPKEELGEDKILAQIHPEDVGFFKGTVEQIVKSKASSQLEFRFLHADGNWMLIECLGTPVIGENGAVEHITMVGRDITEKRKAEELLLKSEKLTVVGELAAGIAHEIRNPLTSIKGFVQLLQQRIIKEEFFDVIMAEFDRVEGIIKEFLTLAKPQEMKLKKTDLTKVLQDVETLLRSEAHLQNVQICHRAEQDIPLLTCDPNQIKQVFINLIKNSIEAMLDGGVVNIHVMTEGPLVLIKIIDNGVGITEERLQKLGEPFFSNKEKGTGLGLMLCFRIIREHKGTMIFKSKENQGTTVEVRLPL